MTDTIERKLAEKIVEALIAVDNPLTIYEDEEAVTIIERELLAYGKQVREEQIDKDGDILQAQAYILNDYAQQDERSMAKLHVVNFLERRIRAQSSKEGKLP